MDKAVEKLRAAIDAYFGDTKRSQQDTRDGLIDLKEHIDVLIEILPTED